MAKRAAFLVILLLALQAALATSYPLTVKDELGGSLTLTHAPRRIVSMIPSDTETVCALGACGSLVLTDEYSGLAPRLRNLGLPVYAGTPQTFEQALTFFGTLGRLLDRQAEAAVLRGRVEGQVATVAAKVAGLNEPSVFVELDPTPYSVGPASYLGTLLAKAGGRNIVGASMGEYPQVDPEYVVKQDPEVVLLMDAPYGESVAKAEARPGWSTLRAVEDGRVLALDRQQVDMLSRAGPRMGDAVVLLARLLHPGHF
ncbi:MAG: helical backbone metal receptor [Deinococcales bacterium]